MKSKLHAIAGVLGFIIITSFMTSSAVSLVVGSVQIVALVKTVIFWGMFPLLGALVFAGATGVSLLGKRTDSLAMEKQKRGPRAFMTALLVLLPISIFLWIWSASGSLGPWFYGLQTVELLASLFAAVNIGLNIRDGLALRGRISSGRVSMPTIEARDGGPLVVMQNPALTGSDGSPLASPSVMALCRCGASKNKPYCDGSHNVIGFDSTPSDDRTKDEVLTYEGSEVTIHYNRLLCSHAAECGRRQKAAFDSTRKPWIIPDNASTEALEEVVQACPSGALRLSMGGAAPEHSVSEDKGIRVERNGPYRVTGVPLAEARLADGASPDKFVLCRCGASKNKPYCDGSHFDIAWKESPAG